MVLYLSHHDTIRLDIRLSDLIELFEKAHRLLALDKAVYSPRVRLVYPPIADQGDGRPWRQNLRILSAILPEVGAGVRLGGSSKRMVGSGGSVLVLLDFETMELKAIISDFFLHGVRSGAPNGLAAKHLSRSDAKVVGVIGSGRVARWATLAVCSVRPIEVVKVFSPNPEHRLDYVRFIKERLPMTVLEHADPESVVRDSDIVVTATNSPRPVLKGEWLMPGSTIITNTPEELDRDTVRRVRLVLNLKEEFYSHVPPYQAIMDLFYSGELSEAQISTELGDLLLGRKPGRASEDEILAYVNAGSGIYDVVMASYAYQQAKNQGIGTWLTT